MRASYAARSVEFRAFRDKVRPKSTAPLRAPSRSNFDGNTRRDKQDVGSRKLPQRNPRLAGEELSARDAPADAGRKRYLLGRPQSNVPVGRAARLVRAGARQEVDRAALAGR